MMTMMMIPSIRSSSSYFVFVVGLLLLVSTSQTVCQNQHSQYHSPRTTVVAGHALSFSSPSPFFSVTTGRTTTTATRMKTGTMRTRLSLFGPCRNRSDPNSITCLHMAAKATKKKNKKKVTSGSGGGLKGFGSPTLVASSSSPSSKSKSSSSSSKSTTQVVEIDKSKETRDFYDYLERNGAGQNLNRCALGMFQLNNDDDSSFKLRGVVALRPIKKGDDIINIPYDDCAINLGQEGSDPTIPALQLLKDYCVTLSSNGGGSSSTNTARAAYYRMLPPFEGDDCMGSTDFFSDEALDALQSPLIVEETLNRRQLVKARFEEAGLGGSSGDGTGSEATISWIDGTPLTERHLLWAVWLITSRVLTVQGQEGTGQSFRLLIPFLDMCNHDRSSTHILTGRAVPGGQLKVVAGSKISEGEQINIVYGGGNAGNNRFIQDYGFIDTTSNSRISSTMKKFMEDKSDNDDDESDDNNDVAVAFTMVAQELVGKRRVVEGASANKYLSQHDRTRSLEALAQTSIEDDERLLADETTDSSLISAYKYRIGVKRALSKVGAFDDS